MKQYWEALINWGGWKAAARWWDSVLRWEGWSAIAQWSGWKKLLHPPVALLVRLPGLIRGTKTLIHRVPFAQRLLTDQELKFRLELYREQVLNFGYGLFKCAAALFYRDAWMGTEGFYNVVQGIIQLVQILQRRKNLTLVRQWKSYRLCGYLGFALHLSTTGLAFLMIRYHMAEEYPGYMIFATAAFTFYKLIKTFLEVAKDRKHAAPIDSSVRLMELSQAFFNLFSLQVALLHVFGQDLAWAGLMNTITGSAVSLLMVAMGVYMLRRSKRELRKLTEQEA